MTPEQRQEEISKAYLQAVAAKCGFTIASWSQDHGCVDATVGAVGILGTGTVSSPKIDVQLKATSQERVEHDDFVSCPLEIDHYDYLRAQTHIPHLLVVLLLPSDINDCVVHSVDELIIRRCAYWVKMTGMPPVTTASTTVRLPKANVFSPENLQRIMTQISEGTF